MVLSSSSAASVIVITFVESGLLTFEQCLGVLLGVNIGTTLTGHLVAIKLTKYAWHMVAAGFFAVFFSKDEKTKLKAEILHGLGLLFVGMEVMGNAMTPLQTHEPFRELLASMQDLPLGVASACIFTLLIQSSSAATGVIITVAQQGLLTPGAGLALILGANIGTCGTACLAAIGKKAETIRVAWAYLLFKLIGVALTICFIEQFTDLVLDTTLPAEVAAKLRAHTAAAGTGTANGSDTSDAAAAAVLGVVVPQFLANCHTVFNILLAALCLPFTPQLSAFVVWSLQPFTGTPPPVPSSGGTGKKGKGAAKRRGSRSPSPRPTRR